MSLEGTGITIAFQSGFFAEITAVDQDGVKRADLDASTMANLIANSYARTFKPGKPTDPGGLKIEFFFNPDQTPPISAATETVTVTFPVPDGGHTAAKWVCQGFLTDYTFKGAIGALMTGSATLKWSGQIAVTPST